MAIVDYNYYTGTYIGEPIAGDEFDRAEVKAERIINQITYGRAANYAALPTFQQQAIRDAVCAQVEYYALMGIDVSVNGAVSTGFTVGKVKVDGNAKVSATGAGSMICAAAITALEQTGLMNPQVETLGEPSIVGYQWGCG